METRQALEGLAAGDRGSGGGGGRPRRWCSPGIRTRRRSGLIAAILYGYTHRPLARLEEWGPGACPADDKARVLDEYLMRRGPHDAPLRALEHLDLQLRHPAGLRRLPGHPATPDGHTRRRRSPRPSTAMPHRPEVARYGLGGPYRECMDRAVGRLSDHRPRLSRARRNMSLPLAFRKRVLFHLEPARDPPLRGAALRACRGTTPTAPSPSRVYQELARVHPLLAKYIRVDLNAYDLAR